MSRYCSTSDGEGVGLVILLVIAFALLGFVHYIETSTHPPDKFDRIDSYSSDGTVIHTYVPKGERGPIEATKPKS